MIMGRPVGLSVVFAIATLLFGVNPGTLAAAEAIARVVIPAKRVPVPQGVVDPDCTIASCNGNICLGLPPGSTVKSASLWVQEAGLPLLGPCQLHQSGGFLDCAVLRKPSGAAVGYIRSIDSSFSVSTSSNGVNVCWNAMNWADIPRAVELHVQY